MNKKWVWAAAGICLAGFALFLSAKTNGAVSFSGTKFTIFINGTPYHRSATLSPTLPITAHFEHTNPNVVKVRMQHPKHPQMNRNYTLGTPTLIQNHSRYMHEGVLSYSDFIAIDSKGKEHQRIRLTFKP